MEVLVRRWDGVFQRVCRISLVDGLRSFSIPLLQWLGHLTFLIFLVRVFLANELLSRYVRH